jgi:hypothetical protein
VKPEDIKVGMTVRLTSSRLALVLEIFTGHYGEMRAEVRTPGGLLGNCSLTDIVEQHSQQEYLEVEGRWNNDT